MKNSLTKKELEWNNKYGSLPSSKEELEEESRKIKKVDWDKYNSEKERIITMPMHVITLTLPLVPQSTPRARWSSATHSFYVKGAAENKKIIKRLLEVKNIISTIVTFKVDAYLPTPTSVMRGYEIALAEEGLIRPMITKDWDNIGKTYSDMLQNYLLVNDNIICEGIVNKYFSIKPRVVIEIAYQDDYDSNYNKKRMLNSKSYNNLIQSKKSINTK